MLYDALLGRPSNAAPPAAEPNAAEAHLPDIQIVHVGNFLAVVAPREYDAIQAAAQLKVAWSDVKPPFPEQKELYNHIRAAKPIGSGGANANIKELDKVEAQHEAFSKGQVITARGVSGLAA